MDFIAPKNFKRGRLIANKYTVFDLMIAGIGIGASFIMEIIFLLNLTGNMRLNITAVMIMALPAGIGLLFVVPDGIYHNIFTFMELKIMNLKKRKKYIWGGVRTYGEERKD